MTASATVTSGLTKDQRAAFERDGYLVIPGAIEPDHVQRLTEAVDRVYAAEAEPGKAFHQLAFLGRDQIFIEMVDHPTTLPLAADVLGFNIYMYHCHVDVHPPEQAPDPENHKWMWHQDGGVQNRDLESDPRPRMSVKFAYFLTDVSEPGRGNFGVLPGSHVRNRIERPANDDNDIPGFTPVLASPGDAVMFDRRLWHMRTPNLSDLTRKAIFFAYTFRWVRVRDDMEIPAELEAGLTPLRAQLLGAGEGADHYWMPDFIDLPLRDLLGPHVR